MKAPFNSKKLWLVGMTLTALVIVVLAGHESKETVGAIVSIGGGGVATQGFLDLRKILK